MIAAPTTKPLTNCAVALARAGVGRLIIADFDIVTESNLNRQYYFADQVGQLKSIAIRENIRRINPDVQIDAHAMKLDKDNIIPLFQECDVIVEAFDLADQKEMFMECVLEKFPEKPWLLVSEWPVGE